MNTKRIQINFHRHSQMSKGSEVVQYACSFSAYRLNSHTLLHYNMAQFAAVGAAGVAGMAMAQQGLDMAIQAEDATAAGFNVAADIVSIRPEDLKKRIPQMLNPQGNDPMSGAIRILGAYERFHAAAAERLHPTDNLINPTYDSLLGEMYKELAFQVQVYFCNMFYRMFQQSGEQLKMVMIQTVRETLQQKGTIQEYLIPGVRNMVLRIMERPETRTAVLRHLRGPCYIPETIQDADDVEKPATIFTGGGAAPSRAAPPSRTGAGAGKGMATPKGETVANTALAAATMMPAAGPGGGRPPAPPGGRPPGGGGGGGDQDRQNRAPQQQQQPPPAGPPPSNNNTPPTPLVQLDFMKSPEALKAFLCDSYKRMFTDSWSSIRAIVITNIESMIRDNKEIQALNRKITMDLIDIMFNNPNTRIAFLRHLTGGCAIPKTANITERIVPLQGKMSAEMKAKQTKETEVPVNIFTKYTQPKLR